MAYMDHINNLYSPKGQDILLFKEAWALEKVHGTGAKIVIKIGPPAISVTSGGREIVSSTEGIIEHIMPETKVTITFFSGGEPHEKFVALFDQKKLQKAVIDLGFADKTIEVFGENYGGKQQGMSHTYGKNLKFIVFDVKINECWLDVPKAEEFAKALGLEFVPYHKTSTNLKDLDAWRDTPSEVAIRNGISRLEPLDYRIGPDDEKIQLVPLLGGVIVNPKSREGVVCRPLIEVTKNNGSRIICKHKGDEFRETKTPRPVVDPSKMQVLADAEKIAEEYVVPMRLQHVLDKLPGHCIERMRDIIAMMVEDVEREGKFECVFSDITRKSIGKRTAILYKEYLKSNLNNVSNE